jgi:lipopolysaccharide/colanic/teichoic acid biosynthesis glycosyltransferase
MVISMETKNSRKERILNKFPRFISLPYYGLDFILKRVFPKWKPTRKLYFKITNGRNRVLSRSEGLARMICCGYKIIGYKKLKYKTYIIGKKVKEPAYDMQPTYGALVRLNRVGKGGKIIKVCKMRTMYPYSEYLQDYIYEKYDLKKGGKFSNDFRMTSWGKFFRKYWIDELPMFINYFRGEMKLVGVRPLSRHYFSLYPEELQELRTKVKPGLVPPYYADMPKGLKEIQESERKYLEAYFERPVWTDIRYFFKSFYNIIFKGARSQ